ncbi:glycoside hydrolase family 3 N-terminal domain-containing protein [Nocardioides bruguierae]|uniref:Glycosyl hyrolase family 3 n=1 Tax=Nocardioides bruguierae TaxID=2945102 RepID=A0A9X2D3Y7_9ACTN|nr:glycoside hydrolase family 3 N-terminal domain-containing protein [Nocardioides bruguierae]MCM0618721.1 glycosyl hyrolase family 3 [Nocardioides bruguierae]
MNGPEGERPVDRTPHRHRGLRPRRSRRGVVLGGLGLLGAGALGSAAAWAGTRLTGSGGDVASEATGSPVARRSSGPSGTDEPETSTDTGIDTGDTAADADTPTSWGPTLGEVEQARALVAEMSAAALAGQVIVGRFASPDPTVPAALVRDLGLAGVCVTPDSVTDGEQVRALTAAVEAAVRETRPDVPAVIGVDEEGGSVSHLSGVATTFPAFATAGVAVTASGGAGRRAVREAARWTGTELRGLGFTWVFAPVADVTVGAADVTIGTRSPSSDPEVAATAVTSAVRGYERAGIVSTPKHFPGHGSATVDSHESLPVITSSLEDLRARDLVPFEAAVAAGAPAIMVGHLDVTALETEGLPTSLAPEAYAYLREELGFEGVAITDSLGMGAVMATPGSAVKALAAGADLLLMPADTTATHDNLRRAILDGRVPRERAEEAATRVVALQLWQARAAAATPVPEDVTVRTQQAAADLSTAAYG